MGQKAQRAAELFMEGYNCSQAVLGAFCEDIGMDFEVAIKLASSFGGGMGRLREVCGALSAVFMLAGIRYGYSSPTDKEAKTEHYRLVQAIAAEFRKKRETIICRELIQVVEKVETHIPDDRTAEYYKTRPCVAIVIEAEELAEHLLAGELFWEAQNED